MASSCKDLPFSFEPVVQIRTGLIAALHVELVSSAPDSFFRRKSFDWGFLCTRRFWHGESPATTISQAARDRKSGGRVVNFQLGRQTSRRRRKTVVHAADSPNRSLVRDLH